jgi:antitoxin (DNA-binding transcriptional repressor) of toxin-antitoxin stability system
MKPSRTVPKSVFKAQALQFFREVEITREPIVITDRGKAVLKLVPFEQETPAELVESLRGVVTAYQQPLEPVGELDWAALE